MDISALKPFAQEARRQLLDQVGARLEQVLRIDTGELREKQQTLEELQKQIDQTSKRAMIDHVAYTWFNRFCALRFMDVNHYTRVGIVSPAEGFTQPEILQEAKQGLIDDSLRADRGRVLALLSGKATSSNPQQEAYRLLLVGACNAYHEQMPFLFEPIDDYTELLMPEDLLSQNSVLQATRDVLTPEACKDVEVIGWLYQFYISERKDEVFANLKKNKKIQPEDIPAATQLFTPHWIVRYLVENSLGRLWMLNHPESKLVEQMDYYIRPEQEETDFLKIGSPEEIKVCDPACGSGHMLTYAFDLLYAIYEEQGYDPVEIPRRIVENNLYGIEIDQRAGHLAALALMMKSRERDRRFFSQGVEPKVCVLENVAFSDEELGAYMNAVGRDLFTQDLQETLTQFEQADNFGSLIQPKVKDVAFVRQRIQEQGVFEDLFLHRTNEKVLKVLEQAEYLSPGYHVVVANPPYMSSKGMNPKLNSFSQENYPESKSDCYSMFIVRNLLLAAAGGYVGMITIPNWMFLSSFEQLRIRLLGSASIKSLVHNGRGVWGSDFGSCAFVLNNMSNGESVGTYKRLFRRQGKVNSNETLVERFHDVEAFPNFVTSEREFKQIPGSPIAYWASQQAIGSFSKCDLLAGIAAPRAGLATGDNPRFQRYWYEIAKKNIAFDCRSNAESKGRRERWYPCNSGGAFRKWYGNYEMVVDWQFDGEELRDFRDVNGKLRSRPQNTQYYFRPGVTWTKLSAVFFAARLAEEGFIFDDTGRSAFPAEVANIVPLLAFLCSKPSSMFLGFLNPSLSFTSGDIANLPVSQEVLDSVDGDAAQELIDEHKADWDAFERSWAFATSPLLLARDGDRGLTSTYMALRSEWEASVNNALALERVNNTTFIDFYELGQELSPDVPVAEVTLTYNPSFRYPNSDRKVHTDEEREAMLLEDTMKEFISYAVGCMFGRYSLDKPGLILANQGETVEVYRKQVPDPTYPPDEDNVIPILDEGWFEDDIAERFKRFLRATFGSENYEENLAFLEEAIGKDIRSYFLKSFYGEHVKMYKKRPIYWLFSSPNGSFNALIYMHRYRPDTISVILNDYLRQYREKLLAHRTGLEQVSSSSDASQGEKTKALKEADKVGKILTELKTYEDEILYPLASQQVEIDLDDGVKVNYDKLGQALKHVRGLSV